jgi:hypothetical protein
MSGRAGPREQHDRLKVTLHALAGAISASGNLSYALIGSAALLLHLSGGHSELVIEDVDVVMPDGDARQLLAAFDTETGPTKPHAQFRSAVFARVEIQGGLPLEIMGGFQVKQDRGWVDVWPVETMQFPVRKASVQVASPAALAGLFQMFDRPKDRERLAMLKEAYLP